MTDYFEKLKAAREAARTATPVTEVEQARVGVVRPGRLLGDAAISRLSSRSTPAQIIKRLRGRDWTVKVAWSKAFVTSVRYLDDSPEDAADPHQKGDVRFPAHFLETLVILGRKSIATASMALSATFTRKDGGAWEFRGSETYDPVLGRVWRPSQLKPRPQRDWEKKDDVPAPAGLVEWLKTVAPTAAELNKRQEEAA